MLSLQELIGRLKLRKRGAGAATLEARAELILRHGENRIPRESLNLGEELDPILRRLAGLDPLDPLVQAAPQDYSQARALSSWRRYGAELRSAHQILLGRNPIVRHSTILNGRSTTHHYGIECGDDFYVKEGAYIDAYGGHIRIGRGAAISQAVAIHGNGGVDIGDYVMMGHGSMILAGNHRHDPLTAMPFLFQGSTARGVKVGNNVWIGAGAIILDGVTIDDDVVIGAGTVVSQDIPPGSLVTSSRALTVAPLTNRSTNELR